MAKIVKRTVKTVRISGTGGQGALTIGWILALAAMLEGKETRRPKEYGPAMRGGSANCTVIISNKKIGSPVVRHPDSLIAMNKPSLDRFGPKVKPEGLIIINKSLTDWDFSREDVEVLEIRASEIAQEMKKASGLEGFKPDITNMVILGAYLRRRSVVSFESVLEALREIAKEKKWPQNIVELNEKTLQRGWDEAG